ncbi:type II toxin-antitoxin system VapC family toxin [Magnetospirillum sp. 64-120]|uniref:type II toxin-antitoxin system VapC family toxin n=1 Tax=Magnetospirillum sp. 64-120 TaxID=1895778 RepID=UPI000928B027|nr:type II toxin-antitoxin system VapC family toxin [Magnetospirillum sp. 64-120]OJX68514.1 MAG: hypothetical protein BGO92_18995 [Magnetospirillum sp. 64-120]
MSLVVDASVAVKWVSESPGWQAAGELIGRDTLMAPDLIWPECGNALWRYVGAGLMGAEQARQGLTTIGCLFDRVVPTGPLMEDALALACRLKHPVYDCVYLALARSLGSKLVTADRKLVARLAETDLAGLAENLI